MTVTTVCSLSAIFLFKPLRSAWNRVIRLVSEEKLPFRTYKPALKSASLSATNRNVGGMVLRPGFTRKNMVGAFSAVTQIKPIRCCAVFQLFAMSSTRTTRKNKSERASDVSCHWSSVLLWFACRPSSGGGAYWNVVTRVTRFRDVRWELCRSLEFHAHVRWNRAEPWLSSGWQVVVAVAARMSDRRVACACQLWLRMRTESVMASGVSRVEVLLADGPSATSRRPIETFAPASVRMDRFVAGGFEMYQIETRLCERFCIH